MSNHFKRIDLTRPSSGLVYLVPARSFFFANVHVHEHYGKFANIFVWLFVIFRNILHIKSHVKRIKEHGFVIMFGIQFRTLREVLHSIYTHVQGVSTEIGQNTRARLS